MVGCGWVQPFSLWVEVPACLPFVHFTSGMGTPRSPFQITSAAKKARQVVRVDWSWMDFLSLFLLSPCLFFPPILRSPEASISLITELPYLNGRLCIVRTKGQAASEEVLDKGMDWAQRLGWVELQVQASLAPQRRHKKRLHFSSWRFFHDWEQRTVPSEAHIWKQTSFKMPKTFIFKVDSPMTQQ